MFVLFGVKTVFNTLSVRPGNCRYCHQHAEQRLQERASRFTLFFVPLFTFKRRYQVSCSNCGGSTEISRQQKESLV